MWDRLTLGAALACVAALAGCAATKEAAPAKTTAAAEVTTTTSADGLETTAVVTKTATVEAIDQKTRMVTLRMADGETTTFRVSPEVRNLPQVKKGDEVTASYYESVAVRLLAPGEAKPGVTTADEVTRAEPGQMPAGGVATTTTITATVTKIDRKKQTATLRGPEGKSVTVKVRNPANLEKVKEGDLVEITYTEALAISVEKAARR